MRKTSKVLLLCQCLLLNLSGCSSSSLTVKGDVIFDLDHISDVTFAVPNITSFSHIEGYNIADGDYLFENNHVIFRKDYLIHLNPGTYNYTLYTNHNSMGLSLTVANRNNSYRIKNESFTTGDLFCWTVKTVFKGETVLQSFTNDGVINDGHGNYYYGIPKDINLRNWEEKMGLMQSTPFILGGSGLISFQLGGGKNSDLTYLSIHRVEDDLEIARFGNLEFTLDNPTELTTYWADLSLYLGQTLRLEIADYGGHDYDFLLFGQLEMYHESQTLEGIKAVDIKPTFAIDYAPNQIPNGDFSNNLLGWTLSTQNGWQNSQLNHKSFFVKNGVLRSDESGDISRGLLRSSLFRVDGSGIVSFDIGAAQGARFDKDTYISIKKQGSNREIFRSANTRHNGNQLLTYYVDLSAYLGDTLYLEIVDNGVGSYDTIFVDNVKTYYPTRPNFDFSVAAINLNY